MKRQLTLDEFDEFDEFDEEDTLKKHKTLLEDDELDQAISERSVFTASSVSHELPIKNNNSDNLATGFSNNANIVIANPTLIEVPPDENFQIGEGVDVALNNDISEVVIEFSCMFNSNIG
jgi:hypothetical protein